MSGSGRYFRSDIRARLFRRRGALLLGGLVVQLDHDPVRVVDENLPEVAARNLPRIVRHLFRLQSLLHAVEAAAGKGDVMDHAGIRLLRLVGPGDVDDMHHRLALAVHPRAGKCEVRPRTLLEAHDVLIEADGVVELSGPDVEMIQRAYTHAHAVSPLFCEVLEMARP